MHLASRLACPVVSAFFVASAAVPLEAQEAVPRPPAGRRGSLPVTAAIATGGALVGLGAAALLAPHADFSCPLTPGADCHDPGPAVLTMLGGSLLGATAGAVLGRRLSGGHQSAVRSLLGAGVGLLAGGVLAYALNQEDPALVLLTFSLPQGFFAALAGW